MSEDVERQRRGGTTPTSGRAWQRALPRSATDGRTGRRVGFRRMEDHRSADELTAALDEIRQSPAATGTVELIVRRPAENEREVLDEAMLDLELRASSATSGRRAAAAAPRTGRRTSTLS